MAELDGTTHHFHGFAAIDNLDLEDDLIGRRLFVFGEIGKTLRRCPLTLHRFQMLPPIAEGLCGNGERYQIARQSCIGEQRPGIGKAPVALP
ncbi:MAG: hypothetical protein ABW184_04670 [Sphingobium sp.]